MPKRRIHNLLAVDYKAGYEQIMALTKANGKTMQVKSVEEAIQLMQMGANYTRKMQNSNRIGRLC